MSTDFDDTFSTGDPIDPEHILQLMGPLQDLEEGQAFYRDDIGVADAYEVDFSGAGAGNKNAFAAYQKGQIVLFKAANANTGAATLRVVGSGGMLAIKPLVKPGNVALASNDIKANQMVAAVYNDAGTGRFEMIGAPGGAVSASDIIAGTLAVARGGTGADLSATGGTGKFLKQSTVGGAISVGNIDASSDIASGTLPMARGGTGQSTFSHGDLLVSDGTQLVKLPVGSDGEVLTADSNESAGVKWATGGSGGGGGSSDLLFGDGSDGSPTISNDVWLDENKFYENLTIDNGARLHTNGHRVYVRDTLTLDDGYICCNGQDAQASSGSSAGSPGWHAGDLANHAEPGAWGQVEAGDSQGDFWARFGFSAVGGDGGEGSFGYGGSGSNNNEIAGERYLRSLPAILSGAFEHRRGWNGPTQICAGLGGGGGTGDGTSAAGGSGGGGGGCVWIAARHLSLGYAGLIEAKGGRGGDAGGTDAGGGGGGGGGMIFLLTADSSNPFSSDVSGGYGGTGGGGVGLDGYTGDSGTAIFRGNL